MQHIVVHTAKKANLKADDWVVNGVNRSGMYMREINLNKLKNNTKLLSESLSYIKFTLDIQSN